MARAIALGDDFDAAALRQLAKNSKNGPQIRPAPATGRHHLRAAV